MSRHGFAWSAGRGYLGILRDLAKSFSDASSPAWAATPGDLVDVGEVVPPEIEVRATVNLSADAPQLVDRLFAAIAPDDDEGAVEGRQVACWMRLDARSSDATDGLPRVQVLIGKHEIGTLGALDAVSARATIHRRAGSVLKVGTFAQIQRFPDGDVRMDVFFSAAAPD